MCADESHAVASIILVKLRKTDKRSQGFENTIKLKRIIIFPKKIIPFLLQLKFDCTEKITQDLVLFFDL